MKTRNCLTAAIISALGLLASQSASAANPLAEHRQALRTQAPYAYEIAGSIASAGNDGRIVLSIPSAQLLQKGVRSGDQVAIEIGGRAYGAYVAFLDELERLSALSAQTREEAPPEPGMTLVIDRDRPGQRIVLDASAGGVSNQDATIGESVSIRAIRRKGEE